VQGRVRSWRGLWSRSARRHRFTDICDIRKRFAIWSLAPGSISSAVAIKHAWLTEVGGNSILNGEEMVSS
jgi:hypothetical protein